MHSVMDGTATPAFVTKLWALVEDGSTDHLISWDHTGRSFHVYDQLQFAKEVLPMYFKHGNIASFIRQLNMYGFRKVVQLEQGSLKIERDDMEFQHPGFIRGKEVLLSQVKRKPTAAGVKDGDSRVHKEDVNKVLTDMQALKDKQKNMSGELESMRGDNEHLWREVVSLRQKHTRQQQIVNKLIQFLVTMVQKKPGVGVNRRRPLMINDSTEREDSRPKLPRQYSLESVGGTHYTVDMPDTPGTPALASATSRNKGGVFIREVSDSIPSPGNIDFTDVSDVVGYSNEVMEPLVVDSSQSAITTTSPPHILDQFLQSQAANQTPQTAANELNKTAFKSQTMQLPPSYVTVATNPNTSTAKSNVKGPATQNVQYLMAGQPLNTDTVSSNVDLATQSQPTTSLAVITDTSPSSSLNLSSGSLGLGLSPGNDSRVEINENLENIDADLDLLKELLASGYSLDANTLIGLFDPEGPVPKTPDHLLTLDHPLSGLLSYQKEETDPNNIVGNEVVQYVNPTEDMGNMFDLDGAESDMRFDSNQSIFPDIDGFLNTPEVSLMSPDLSYVKVKQEGRQMEEVD